MPRVRCAAKLFREIIYNNKDSLSASIIVSGWDDIEGAQIYGIKSGGTMLEQTIAMSGSGSTYIVGFVDANFKPNFTYQEARQFSIEGFN